MTDLTPYLPENSAEYIQKLIAADPIDIYVVKARKSKHGDFRIDRSNRVKITMNDNLNPYRFLITLVHEIAHFRAYRKFGLKIAPHGLEWKVSFQRLMLPLLNPNVFPENLLTLLALYLKNPKSSSDGDVHLTKVLLSYDSFSPEFRLYDCKDGDLFSFENKTFKRLNKRRTRILTERISDGRKYVFNPNVAVEPIKL